MSNRPSTAMLVMLCIAGVIAFLLGGLCVSLLQHAHGHDDHEHVVTPPVTVEIPPVIPPVTPPVVVEPEPKPEPQLPLPPPIVEEHHHHHHHKIVVHCIQCCKKEEKPAPKPPAPKPPAPKPPAPKPPAPKPIPPPDRRVPCLTLGAARLIYSEPQDPVVCVTLTCDGVQIIIRRSRKLLVRWHPLVQEEWYQLNRPLRQHEGIFCVRKFGRPCRHGCQ
jgi:hypothetical protein